MPKKSKNFKNTFKDDGLSDLIDIDLKLFGCKKQHSKFVWRNLAAKKVPEKSFKIYTDASRDEKCKICSYAVYFEDIKEACGGIIKNCLDNDKAEFRGIFHALAYAILLNVKNPVIFSDSLNSCTRIKTQADKDYVDSDEMLNFFKLMKISKARIIWIPSHVGIEGNEIADKCARKFLDNFIVDEMSLTFESAMRVT